MLDSGEADRVPQDEIARYIATGDHDSLYLAWPGDGLLDRAEVGERDLKSALLQEIERRETGRTLPAEILELDVTAFTRAKVEPMVRGLFPVRERDVVLRVLETSVVFLTPATIRKVIADGDWLSTSWDLANLYLMSIGAELLSEDAPRIVGLSEEKTCYVSAEYFRERGRFDDFVVHEAAHVFHNTERRTIGLTETRRREWLLEIEFRRRETFAYACEAHSRVIEHAPRPRDRSGVVEELIQEGVACDERSDVAELEDILRDAAKARNGWKRILARCAPTGRRGP
jgi:hypothetical protein